MSSLDSAQRYVAGLMDEAEELAFEESMLENPTLAAEVDARQRMKAGLQLLEQRGQLAALLSQPASPSRFLRYAAAAAVLLVLGGALVYWKGGAPSHTYMAGSLQGLAGSKASSGASVATYLLASTRSRPEETLITAPAGGGLVRIQVVPDSGVERAYTAALAQVSSEGQETVLADRIPVHGTAGGSLVDVYLDPVALQPGDYRLRLISGDLTYDYAFKLSK
jgi:hypothetical protein